MKIIVTVVFAFLFTIVFIMFYQMFHDYGSNKQPDNSKYGCRILQDSIKPIEIRINNSGTDTNTIILIDTAAH